MAAASLSSLPFGLLLLRRSCPRPIQAAPLCLTSTAQKPGKWKHHLQKSGAATMHWKRRETSLGPIYVGRSNGPVEPHPLETLVNDFYSSLNNKDLGRLHELIASDCDFEDLAFPKPFIGQEVHHFLKELTEAMGKDVKFIIDGTYESREISIAVRWHLEWKEKPIPFARGCSFYDCSQKRESLVIKKAYVFTEIPVKPGEFVLELLKIISSLFDKFPKQAKWFLEKPHAMVQFMIKAYKILVEPFILPLLVYYTHLWTFGAQILSYMLNLIQNLLKFLM